MPTHKLQRWEWEKKNLKFTEGTFEVEVSKYELKKPNGRSIIILPPTGGTNYIDRSYAKFFALYGFDVYILDGWSGMGEMAEDLDLHDRLYSRAVKAVKITLTQIPKGYIGMLGTSVGATFAPVIANLEPRIDAVFLIAGGAPIPAIIVHSDQGAMEKLKKARYAKYGFKNDEEYLAELDKHFPLDPFKTPPLFKEKDLGMVISPIDTTVPAAYQMDLKDLWKPTTLYSVDRGHFMTIISTWWSRQPEVLNFFEESARKRSGQ